MNKNIRNTITFLIVVFSGIISGIYFLQQENKNLNLYSFDIHGWVGQHEKFHTNGIITDLDLQKKLQESRVLGPQRIKVFKNYETRETVL